MLASTAIGSVPPASAGPIVLSGSGVPYTQNFDTLWSASNGQVKNSPANQELSQAAWNSAGTGSTTGGTSASGWWQNGGNGFVRAADGSSAGGGDNNDVTSWGAIGSAERALGLGSSSSATASFGAQFTNATASTISELDVSFTGEQWREGTQSGTRTPDTLAFEYSTNATSLTSGTWIAVAALNFKSLQTNAVNFGALDGNQPANQQALSAAITGLNIPNGTTFFLRWRSVNNATGNDGLGIDNLSVTPIAAGGQTNTPAGIYFSQVPTDCIAGGILSPGVVVVVTNAGGASLNGLNVSVSLSSGSGTLSGTLTRTTTGGAATFSDLSVSAPGAKTLRATCGTLTVDAGFNVNPAAAGAANYNRIGTIWTSWDPSHFANYSTYIDSLTNRGINFVCLNPTYFINTYAEGITNIWEGTEKTPSLALQKTVLKELIRRGFSINYRPHVDPIKYAMPTGSTRDNWSTDPGGKSWRGHFDQLDPTSPTIGYLDRVILPELQILAEAIREAGPPVRPVRFDLGAELMDSMLSYPTHWQQLQAAVRGALTNQYSDVSGSIILGHNFCHHIQYLLRLPGYSDYLARIEPDLALNSQDQYLDRPGVTQQTKIEIGKYIAGLDEMSISQYLPLDIFNSGGDATNTTPAQVARALIQYEDDFINQVLLGELQIPATNLPVLNIGEYGMGIRGLAAPNVWDSAAWIAAGNGNLLLPDAIQKQHAEIAIKGIIQYAQSPERRNRSVLLWLGGPPYDILGLNTFYSQGWTNAAAAGALLSYWATNTLLPPADDGAGPTFQIVATAGTGGTITPSGSVNVLSGQDHTFTILPDLGYSNTDLLINGVSVGPRSSYTFTNITANATLYAQFSGSPAYLPVANAGTNQTVYDVDGDGFALVTLDGSGSSSPGGNPLTYLWMIGSNILGSTATIQAYLPAGINAATLTVSDGIYSNTAGVSVTVITALQPGTHDQEEYQYSGAWTLAVSGGSKYNGDDRYSSQSNAWFQIVFQGTKVQVYGTKDAHHGNGGVSVDGGLETVVSYYSATRLENALIWTSPELAQGLHTIRMRVLGNQVITADRSVIFGAAVPPMIATSGYTKAGGYEFNFSGPSGQPFRILWTTNLGQPPASWTSVQAGTFVAGQMQFSHPDATNHPQGFYLLATP